MYPALADKRVRIVTVIYPIFKGVVIGIVSIAVTSDFADAFVIALTSGMLGIVGMVLSAFISTRNYQKHLEPDLSDVKRKVGANRRDGDEESTKVDVTIKDERKDG